MPLSPKVRAERRAQQKKLEEPKKTRRRRCDNCDNRFHPARKDQRFCCGNCRKEFFRNGGNAFGPLKVRLEKLVHQITRELELRLDAIGTKTMKCDWELEHRISTLEAEVFRVLDPSPEVLAVYSRSKPAHR